MATVMAVEETYNVALTRLRDLANSNEPNVTDEQRKSANASIQDMLLAHAIFLVSRIEGRTAMLTALIAELEEVTKTLQVNPVGKFLGSITEVVNRARDLYADAKAEIRKE